MVRTEEKTGPSSGDEQRGRLPGCKAGSGGGFDCSGSGSTERTGAGATERTRSATLELNVPCIAAAQAAAAVHRRAPLVAVPADRREAGRYAPPAR
jgi:hypothetical protein